MTAKPLKPIWKRPIFGWIAAGFIWTLVLLFVALPAWRTAMDHHREVQELENGLAVLDTWTVAGKWLEKSMSEHSEAVEKNWLQTFPAQRDRENLFLDLAMVADHSRVENFNLEEMKTEGTAAFLVSPPQESVFGGSVYGVPVEVPQVSLDSYRVKASFNGSYHQAADFLGSLQQIKRALSVHNLVVRPKGEGIRVDLELDVYVSQQS